MTSKRPVTHPALQRAYSTHQPEPSFPAVEANFPAITDLTTRATMEFPCHGCEECDGPHTPPDAPCEPLGGAEVPSGTVGIAASSGIPVEQARAVISEVAGLIDERDRARQLAADLEAESARLTAIARGLRDRGGRAEAALDRVRALHRKATVYGECPQAFGCDSDACVETTDGDHVHTDDPTMDTCDECWDREEELPEWPCPTIRALDGAGS